MTYTRLKLGISIGTLFLYSRYRCPYISASASYAVNAAIYVFSVGFKKEHKLKYGAFCTVVGLVPHNMNRGLRDDFPDAISIYPLCVFYAILSIYQYDCGVLDLSVVQIFDHHDFFYHILH